MNIPDNVLAAYQFGITSQKEDLMVLNEMAQNAEFDEMMELLEEINSIDDIDELDNLKFEFTDKSDTVLGIDKIR